MSDKFEWTDLLAAEFAGRVSQLRNERDLPELLQKFKEEKTHKEWEIMSSDNTPAILSVKRLSDGEVFSVGDEVEYWLRGRLITGAIGGFDMVAANLIVIGEPGRVPLFLKDLIKVVKPKPLFVTEDGVEIFDEDTVIYRVWPKEHWNQQSYTAKFYNPHRIWKTFSCKEAADEYILYNKPMLSIVDVMGVYQTSISAGEMFGFLKGLCNKKLTNNETAHHI